MTKFVPFGRNPATHTLSYEKALGINPTSAQGPCTLEERASLSKRAPRFRPHGRPEAWDRHEEAVNAVRVMRQLPQPGWTYFFVTVRVPEVGIPGAAGRKVDFQEDTTDRQNTYKYFN